MQLRSFKHLLLALIVLIAVERVYFGLTKGFRPSKIASTRAYNPQFEAEPLPPSELKKINAALSGPFYFLGRGVQCYAFENADRTLVLKVFKQHRMKEDHFLKKVNFILPSFEKWRKKRIDRIDRRRPKSFSSYLTAQKLLKEETGLLFCHLNTTEGLFNKSLILVDAVGIKHTIDLDKTEFLLQKKSKLAHIELNELLAKEDLAAAKKRIDSLISLFVIQAKKGVHDNDVNFRKNYGFIGDDAIKLDVGSFHTGHPIHSKEEFKKELLFQTKRMRHWIKKNQPQLLGYLDHATNQAITHWEEQ